MKIRDLFESGKQRCRECVVMVRERSAALAVLVAGLLGLAASKAHASGVTIPDSGADVDGYISAAITSLGAVVAVAVGGFFAFLIVKLGLRWARKLAG